MGKGVLIFVMASSLSLGAMYMAGSASDVESAQNEADYKAEVIARETAVSAYNIVSSNVRRSFDSYRDVTTNVSYGKAKYDIGATENDDGSVTIIAVGKYGDHEYEIIGSVSRDAETVVDALTILAPISNVSLGGDAQISGLDQGGAGAGPGVHGVLATNSAAYEAFSDESSHITGIGGDGDVIQGDPYIEMANLRSSIKSYSGANLRVVSEDKTWNGENSLGSSGSPAVVKVSGNLTLEGEFEGYGALFVEGNLTMEGDAVWHGVVYQSGSDSAFSMEDDAMVDGGVIIDGMDSGDQIAPSPIDDSDRGLPGGHFDVDVFDEEGSTREIYHEHKYDDKYDTKGVDILSAGCKKPGLCWGQVMGSVDDDVVIRTLNAGNSEGSYEIKVGGTTYTGNTKDAIDLTVDPQDLDIFTFNFTSLCSLAPSKPSDVQDDVYDRNGAFTVQVFDEDGEDLLYELSIYHHWKPKDGENTCNRQEAFVAATEWIAENGSMYSGDDDMCVSEDDNDDYSDWTERESKWGKRKRKDKSAKSEKSEKSDKSDKSEKSDKSDKSEKSEKSDKSDKSSKKWWGSLDGDAYGMNMAGLGGGLTRASVASFSAFVNAMVLVLDDSSKKSSKKSDKSDKSSKKWWEQSDKSSKKSSKSTKKGDWSDWDDSGWFNDAEWYGDVAWDSSGDCAKSNENDDVDGASPSFSMEDDTVISYNAAALKRLKNMLQQFDMADGTPKARQLVQTSSRTLENLVADVGGEVQKTGTRLVNDTVIKDARNLLKTGLN